MYNEMMFDVGNGPPARFPTLDSDGLASVWPRFFKYYVSAMCLYSVVTTYHRNGYMGPLAKTMGALMRVLMFRAPFLLFGVLITALVRKSAGEQAAEEGEADAQTAGSFKVVYWAWCKTALLCVGATGSAALLGMGIGILPRKLWCGTNVQLQNYYKRAVIKSKNLEMFCVKRLKSLRKSAEADRDAIPVSDSAYAVYYSVTRNPEDPFYEYTAPEETIKGAADGLERGGAAGLDAAAILEDDTGEVPSVRRSRLLASLRAKDHQAIARVRMDLVEAIKDLELAREDIFRHEKALESLETSGRAGFGPKGIAGAVGAGITAWFGVFSFFYFVFAPIATSRQLTIKAGLWGLLADPMDVDDGGGKPFWYPVMLYYFAVCIVVATLEWRRLFFVYNLSLDGKTHMGGVMRLTELWMHFTPPFFMLFQNAVSAWSWELDDLPETSFSSVVMGNTSVFPVFGTFWTLGCCWLVAFFAAGTAFFNLPGRIVSARFRQNAADLVKAEAALGTAAAARVNLIAIFGDPIEGHTLSIEGQLVGDPAQCQFQWTRRRPEEAQAQAQPIPGATAGTHMPLAEDIGLIMGCIVTPPGQPATHVELYEKIKMSLPVLRDIRIEGGPYHSAGFSVRGTYFGGVEGSSRVQWYKIKNGAASVLPGANEFTFQPTIDEVACMLKVDYTPVRSDGIVGTTVSAECPPVKIDPVVGKCVKNNIILGAVAFDVQINNPKNGKMESAKIICNDKEIRIMDKGGKVLYKDYLGPHVTCTLNVNDRDTFYIKPGQGDPYTFKADTNTQRDEVALSIRSFTLMSGDRAAQKAAKKLGQR